MWWSLVTLHTELLGRMQQSSTMKNGTNSNEKKKVRAVTEECQQQPTIPTSLPDRVLSPPLPTGRPRLMSHSFVMSQRMKSVSPWAPKLFCFAVWHAVSSVSFRWFFLLTNCLVVEVGEGCREKGALSWTGARVCCWVFRGRWVLCAACRVSSVRVCVCVCVCECVCVSVCESLPLPWESLAAGVTCSNGKLCCTVQNLFWTGSPTVSSAKCVTEQAHAL